MKPHILETTTIVSRPLEEVFSFFSKAENLSLLSPPDLSFRILTPLPVEMKKGALIDYRISLHGIPFRWQTLISRWEPPHAFTDEQISGPYAKWIHTHTFKAIDHKTTEMKDRVEFLSPGLLLEPLINRLFVEEKVKKIFSYRERRMKEIFN